MKKIIVLALSFILVVSLAGCKSGNTDQPSEPIQSSVTVAQQISKTPEVKATEAPEVTASLNTEISGSDVKEPVNAQTLVPENAGDFALADRSFCWDESTELLSIVLGIFPVDAERAVLQFEYYDATDDEEIPVDEYYSFTFTLVNEATYRNEETGISVFIDADDEVTVSAEDAAYGNIVGSYYSAGNPGSPDKLTILEFLRNIPAASVGDFGKPGDVIEENISSAWFHEVSLYRDGKLYKDFVATDDMTAFCEVRPSGCVLIHGSLDTTLEQINYYDAEAEIESEDIYEEESIFLELLIVYPFVWGGTCLNIGDSTQVDIFTPWDIPFSFTVSSADEGIVSVSGDEITAVAEGETELKFELNYAGSLKEYSVPITVSEFTADSAAESSKFIDWRYSSWADVYSQRATMEMFNEDEIYSVDIFWADGADLVHHWSLIGEVNPEDEFTVILNGSYAQEIYDAEGNCSETILYDDIMTILSYEDSGCLRWISPDQESLECLFERIQ